MLGPEAIERREALAGEAIAIARRLGDDDRLARAALAYAAEDVTVQFDGSGEAVRKRLATLCALSALPVQPPAGSGNRQAPRTKAHVTAQIDGKAGQVAGHTRDVSRSGVLVTVPGKGDHPRIWVVCHTDVVPPGEKLEDGTWSGWRSDPFAMRREGDRIIGRGVEDNQQAIVVNIGWRAAAEPNGTTLVAALPRAGRP